jgi:uncharacterized damage-inducible protein DinB
MRIDPDRNAPELESIEQYLDFQRATVVLKTEGLTAEQMATKAIASSDLTLGGLLYHLALVEESWMEVRFAGLAERPPWIGIDWDADPTWEFRTSADLTPDQLRERYEEACERSRQVVASASGPDQLSVAANRDGIHFSLRWVLLHLIEETARHAGHADFLREAIDGVTGE